MSALSDILARCLDEVQNPGKKTVPQAAAAAAALIRKTSLFYNRGTSDKVYLVSILLASSNGVYESYTVNVEYGRRGKSLRKETKTAIPVTLSQANYMFENIVREKQAKGYQVGGVGP